MTINPCSSILDYLAVRPDIGRWRIQFSASMISKLKSHVQALMITHFLHLSSSTLIPIYSWLSLSIKSNPFLVTFFRYFIKSHFTVAIQFCKRYQKIVILLLTLFPYIVYTIIFYWITKLWFILPKRNILHFYKS